MLDGTHNLFIALSTEPKPEEMLAGLGSRFYVTETAIKTFSVGYPIQSPLDALLALRKEYGLTPDNVSSILVKLPTDAIGIVGDERDARCQLPASGRGRPRQGRGLVRRQPRRGADA